MNYEENDIPDKDSIENEAFDEVKNDEKRWARESEEEIKNEALKQIFENE